MLYIRIFYRIILSHAMNPDAIYQYIQLLIGQYQNCDDSYYLSHVYVILTLFVLEYGNELNPEVFETLKNIIPN